MTHLAIALLFLQGMATIPSGSYAPLHEGATARVRVARFALDREAVTGRDYLRFVKSHPMWRRSTIDTALAERSYLAEWRGDLEPGDAADLRRPVTGVSWFAADAYCSAAGKRLPTVDEWEYAAAASETERDAVRRPEFTRRVLDLYMARAANGRASGSRGFTNVYGISSLHGQTWEWTAEFNGERPSEHSHHAAHKHDSSCAGAAIGAPDPTNYPGFMRFAFRSALTRRTTVRSLGFRCAADLPQ